MSLIQYTKVITIIYYVISYYHYRLVVISIMSKIVEIKWVFDDRMLLYLTSLLYLQARPKKNTHTEGVDNITVYGSKSYFFCPS